MRAHRSKNGGVGRGQASLFGPLEVKYEPRIYRCEVCGEAASYGQSWPPSESEHWFCRHHVPAGFLPDKGEIAA